MFLFVPARPQNYDHSQGKTLTMIAMIIATKKEVDAGFSMATLIGMSLHYTKKSFLADTNAYSCPPLRFI